MPADRQAVEAGPRYAGLATRVISFVIDAALIMAAALIVALAGAVLLFALHLPRKVDVVVIIIGGVVNVVWSLGYFVAFWSSTGQSPGARVMQIRVQTPTGERIKPRRALLRCLGMFLAALPLFAGYLPVLFDRDRRAFQDYLARTVVTVETDQLSLAAVRKARTAAASDGVRRRADTSS